MSPLSSRTAWSLPKLNLLMCSTSLASLWRLSWIQGPSPCVWKAFYKLLNINVSLTSFQWTGRVPQPGDWPIPAHLLQPKSKQLELLSTLARVRSKFSPQNILVWPPSGAFCYFNLLSSSGLETPRTPRLWTAGCARLEQPGLGLCDSIPPPRSSQGRISRCLPATSGSISCARNLAPGMLALS